MYISKLISNRMQSNVLQATVHVGHECKLVKYIIPVSLSVMCQSHYILALMNWLSGKKLGALLNEIQTLAP